MIKIKKAIKINSTDVKIYFEEPMDIDTYSVCGSRITQSSSDAGISYASRTIDSVVVYGIDYTGQSKQLANEISVQIFGGK